MTTPPLPLCDLKPGHQGTLLALNGGRGLTARLAALGFTPGVRIAMLQNYGHGPLLVEVRQTRVALGRGEAQRILITEQQS
ncbi:MAG: ferrous iron transport protein A [Anaerolineae bacterium]|nr:ferrous iron transport protein A [Anaerolineae bacterium]